MWRLIWVVGILFIVGCTERNARSCLDDFCEDPALPFCDADGSFSGEPGTCIAVHCTPLAFETCLESKALICNASGDNFDVTNCVSPTSVCDVASEMCVQCTVENTAACSGSTPICFENSCVGCRGHDDCSSKACLPDGSCADESAVAYVHENGSDTGECTSAAPCATLSKALTTSKSIVKIDGVIVETSEVVLGSRDLNLLAETSPQASLTRTTTGPIVRVDGSGAVAIHGLQISGAASAATGVGLQVELSFSGTLVVDRVKLYDNKGGGLYLLGTGRFTVTNSVFAYNGQASGATKSVVGGVAITNDSFGSRFEFNTIAFNASSAGTFVGGVSCNAPMVSAQGNLIYENYRPDGTSIRADATSQRSGNCDFGSSVASFGPSADPKFVRPDAAPLDFHLTASSPESLIDVVGCTGTDLDGLPRPLGSNCDLGADEAR